jgi:hypothetical protein
MGINKLIARTELLCLGDKEKSIENALCSNRINYEKG